MNATQSKMPMPMCMVKTLITTLMMLAVGCAPVGGGGSVAAAQVAAGAEIPAYDESEDIVRHLGYTASYNHTTLCPDWVAWVLTESKARGTEEQQRNFSRDPDVKFPKASREDYSNCGYDKGHMAPHADMKWSRQAMTESDYFTNICPQDHKMNAGAWRKIEELTRAAALRHGAVMVVCGPLYDSAEHRHIGPACVHVPDRFYKALAICSDGGEWHTVGFIVDNNPQNGSARSYAVSVDSVESMAGRDLFPSVPDEAERSFDWSLWRR